MDHYAQMKMKMKIPGLQTPSGLYLENNIKWKKQDLELCMQYAIYVNVKQCLIYHEYIDNKYVHK